MIKIFNDKKEIKYSITKYQLDIFPLDNFSSFGFILDGEYFQTCEHAFQYLKFIKNNPEIALKIKNAFSPNEAREIAQENKHLRLSNWAQVKYKIMEKVLLAKVKQNNIVREKLLDTKDYIIAEFCIDEDTDWGIDKKNNGQNNLGKIWMKIRDELNNTL